MTLSTIAKSVRVISYLRFSSWRQRGGDSFRRQTEMALAYCARHGLTLDTDYVCHDLGVSGFSGKNSKTGALSVLQKLARSGDLEEGTVLLLEAFDRLTRLPISDAVSLFLDLIDSGLVIVTLTDEQVWDRKTVKNFSKFFEACSTLYRGHNESQHKSDRLKTTFEAAREAGRKSSFGSAPGWLHRDSKTSPWVVNDELAQVVTKVFELSASGLGSKAIAGIANAGAWPVPTRLNLTEGRWHAQMAGSLLRNRAVLGEHEHRHRTQEMHEKHWAGAPTGGVISDYYPRIVSDNLWHRARASIDSRRVPKRRDVHYFNIWAGLLYCGCCGAPLQRKSELNGMSKAQIVCADKLANITDCRSFAASGVDTANGFDARLLGAIYANKSSQLYKDDGLVEEITVLEAKFRQASSQADKIADAISKTDDVVDAFVAKSVLLGRQIRAMSAELAVKRSALEALDSNVAFDETFHRHAMSHLYEVSADARLVRAELHQKLFRLVDTIFVWGYDVAVIKFKDGGVPQPVALQPKILPSRANPNAKYHKPPKARPEVPRPFLMRALLGELPLPTPRRPKLRNVAMFNSDAALQFLSD
jgi:DNA invertase Pin-like site-specific DNA recombinase